MKGSNGFVCLVERSWGAATDFPEFWNPKIMAPFCVNPPAARTYLPGVLMKAKLVLAGKSRTEIARAVASALDKKELPALEPGAMCYMMSKQQYLNDDVKNWHPHLMWFVPGDAAKSWGANMPSSPVIAAEDPEDRMTIFLVWVGHWSDGTQAPQDTYGTLAPHPIALTRNSNVEHMPRCCKLSRCGFRFASEWSASRRRSVGYHKRVSRDL